jgi:small subunit ribosomal protein S2
MPFVNQRWLGGMLTNFATVYKRLQRLKELEEIDFDDVAGSTLTKKELLQLRREHDKLERSLGGIRDMARVPSALWVVDTKKEHIAVSEARKLGIPVIAILDTNCDPDEVTYPIPGNDDAIRSVALLTRVIADAVADGLIARAGAAVGEEKPAVAADGLLGAEEPLPEWERALLEGAGDGAAVNGAAAANGTAVAAAARTAAPAADTATAPADTATADTATADSVTATPDAATADAATPDTAAAPADTAAATADSATAPAATATAGAATATADSAAATADSAPAATDSVTAADGGAPQPAEAATGEAAPAADDVQAEGSPGESG